jgi:hypothetical protein
MDDEQGLTPATSEPCGDFSDNAPKLRHHRARKRGMIPR